MEKFGSRAKAAYVAAKFCGVECLMSGTPLRGKKLRVLVGLGVNSYRSAAGKSPIFSDKYHQDGGFFPSQAMLVNLENLPKRSPHTVDGSEIRLSPVQFGSFAHYLQDFMDPRWCRISAINSSNLPVVHCSYYNSLATFTVVHCTNPTKKGE